MNNINTSINTFYKLIYDVIKNNIDGDTYITKIQDIVNNDLDLTTIKNVKKIIFLLKQHNMKLVHSITMLIYTRQCLYKTILEYIKIDKKFSKKMNRSGDSKKILDNVIELKKYLKVSTEYVKAFGNIHYSVHSDGDKVDSLLVNKNYNVKEVSELNYRTEIITRFRQLTKYYGLSKLKYFNIELISYEDALDMSYRDLLQLYNTATRKIKISLQKVLNICDMYLGIERGIILMLLTKDPNINMGKYDVFIEDE